MNFENKTSPRARIEKKTNSLANSKSFLVEDCHRKVFHDGKTETSRLLGPRYLILRRRALVRRIIKTRILCKKLKGSPFNPISSKDLPNF